MLQTGLGWVRALGWFCVVSPARRPHNQLLKLRSDMLCTFQIISVLEDELLRNVEVPQFDVLKLFFFPCWTKYDKASHSICILRTC